uniref:TOBE domain-containing protein n=1 Tax=Neorhizobium sp. EC2-8 TaxID=3129230 RepID=UPI0031018039
MRISGHATFSSDLVLNGEAEQYRPGGRVRVAIRPEDIIIRQRFEPSHQSGIMLRGTVEAVIFLGQAHVILVQIEGQGRRRFRSWFPRSSDRRNSCGARRLTS